MDYLDYTPTNTEVRPCDDSHVAFKQNRTMYSEGYTYNDFEAATGHRFTFKDRAESLPRLPDGSSLV